MNLLISTLGATPDIIEETVGLFYYDGDTDFYRGNAVVVEMRKGLTRLDEVWLVATDQKHIVNPQWRRIVDLDLSKFELWSALALKLVHGISSVSKIEG